jgi:O-antigen/teichoic acid export membrane protein
MIKKIISKFQHKEVFGVIKQSLGTIVVRVFGALSGFLLNLIIARTLEINSAGLFFIVLSVVTTLAQLSTFGMGNALLRFIGIAKDKKDYTTLNTIFSTVFLFVLCVSIVIASMLFFFSGIVSNDIFKQKELQFILEVSTLAIPSAALLALFVSAFQSIGRPVIGLLLQAIIQPLLFFIICWVVSPNLKQIVLIYVITNLATLPLAFLLWRKIKNIRLVFKYDKNVVMLLKGLLLSYFGISVIDMLIRQLPLLIGASFISPREIAYISICIRIAGLTSFVLMAVNMVLAPKLSSLYSKKDSELIEELCKKMTLFMLLLAIPLLIVMLFFPYYILLLFGAEYTNAENILRILALGQFINVATGSVGVLLVMSGNQKDFLKMKLFNFLILICLLIIGSLLQLGVTYIAVSILIGVSVQNLGAYFLVKKKLGISTFPI